MIRLTISIVTYIPDQSSLSATLKNLSQAISLLQDSQTSIWVIDNTPPRQFSDWLPDLVVKHSAQLIHCHGNIGFGRGHNLILDNIGDYHLILNPDVELAEDSLISALDFMEKHPKCGLLVPFVTGPDGTLQYLCKRRPAVLDLFLRGFAPLFIKSLFQSRLHNYEMRDVISSEIYWDPPMVSGCCMLFRKEVLQALSGFDPDFFLYYEDSDISLRTSVITRIVYYPDMKIVHHGGDAARKGLRHIAMFTNSAAKFFNKHGWRWI